VSEQGREEWAQGGRTCRLGCDALVAARLAAVESTDAKVAALDWPGLLCTLAPHEAVVVVAWKGPAAEGR
jgi:hypothetical protein